MKKQYEEPQTEVIRYQAEDIILTSSHHHCGTGAVTGHEYQDTTGDNYCNEDDDYHCGTEHGDYTDCGSYCGTDSNSGCADCGAHYAAW